MALLRTFRADDHLPDYGLVVVHDSYEDDPSAGPDPLSQLASVMPSGTIVIAGDGWLQAPAHADHIQVTLEAHDSAPPDDRAGWSDVAETPYHAGTGAVFLDYLITNGYEEEDLLSLGPPGMYRVRVSCRRHDPGQVRRLQFWPEPGRPEPPQTLARGGPALKADRPEHLASDLAALVLWTQLPAPVAITIQWLADRLLATPEDVRSTLRYAADADLLSVQGDLSNAHAALTLNVLPGRR